MCRPGGWLVGWLDCLSVGRSVGCQDRGNVLYGILFLFWVSKPVLRAPYTSTACIPREEGRHCRMMASPPILWPDEEIGRSGFRRSYEKEAAWRASDMERREGSQKTQGGRE